MFTLRTELCCLTLKYNFGGT